MERATLYGRVTGAAADNGVLAWKGVPYAQAPVGDLRWQAPVAPLPWTGSRPAREFAAPCVQVGRLYGPGRNNRYDATIGACLGEVTGSEDCLYLNIWAPPDAAGPLPVIVYVHGGSNITGYAADPLYDGAALAAAANVVVVTLTYRLGIFGFLNLAQLKTGASPLAASGNFALLDILQALRFVNQNIGAFHGDPSNVTLMGQSAGAVNLWALLASPLLAGAAPALVRRALPISGSVAMAADLAPGQLPVLAPAAAHAVQGQSLLLHALVRAGFAADSNAAAACIAAWSDEQCAAWLRAQSAASLLHTVRDNLAQLGLAASGPIPDGAVVPLSPLAAIRAGAWCQVPVLAGFTRDEGKLFPAMLGLAPVLGGVPGRLLDDAAVFALQYSEAAEPVVDTTLGAWIPPSLLPADAPSTGFNARMHQLNALFFHPNRDAMMDAVRAQQSEAWCYQFDWDEQAPPFDVIYGAAHGFDVPFLFGNFGPAMFAATMNTRANRPGRLALSRAMMRCVGAFAWHGDPNHGALGTHWPAWPALLHFDASASDVTLSVDRAGDAA